MLLNSYEGFDYMDYSRYSMCTKDWGIVFIKSMAATVIIAYLFYDSPIVVIAFPAVFAYCAKLCRQEGVRRQKEKLNEEFMNVLKVLSSNMLAGYSVENAWQEAEKEIEIIHQPHISSILIRAVCFHFVIQHKPHLHRYRKHNNKYRYNNRTFHCITAF